VSPSSVNYKLKCCAVLSRIRQTIQGPLYKTVRTPTNKSVWGIYAISHCYTYCDCYMNSHYLVFRNIASNVSFLAFQFVKPFANKLRPLDVLADKFAKHTFGIRFEAATDQNTFSKFLTILRTHDWECTQCYMFAFLKQSNHF
jgi:hypothetical protein